MASAFAIDRFEFSVRKYLMGEVPTQTSKSSGIETGTSGLVVPLHLRRGGIESATGQRLGSLDVTDTQTLSAAGREIRESIIAATRPADAQPGEPRSGVPPGVVADRLDVAEPRFLAGCRSAVGRPELNGGCLAWTRYRPI